MASTADRAFWPPIQALFDFTLLFEDTILKILPSGLAVVLSPAVVGYYFRQPVYVQHSPLLWLKLAVAFCLVGIEITALVFQCQIAAARTSATIAAASLDVALALVIGLVLFAEHKHAIRTSAFLGLYLALGAVIDATRSRSYFLRPGLEIFGYLSASAGATRLALSIPEEIPKQVSLPDGSTEDLGKEATSGYWSRTIFLWLNSTLWLGFRTILSLKDLGSIGPEFSSKKLYARFQSVWKETKSHSSHIYLLERSIDIVGDPKTPKEEEDAIIGAVALVFVGLAISKATTEHLKNRQVTRTRGTLVTSIVDKTHRLSVTDAKKSAALTLMSTDVEGIAVGIPKCYEIPIGVFEAEASIFFLVTRHFPDVLRRIFPGVFLQIWISVAPTNMVYFAGYVAVGAFAVVMCALSYWFLFLRLSPRASASLHDRLLHATIKSTLAFFTTTDTATILNRYSQDVTLISQALPEAMHSTVYALTFQILQIGVIISGTYYMTAILVPMTAVAYAVQYSYLRTSRQLRFLDLEAKAPLYAQFTETAEGLLHVHAFGWKENRLALGMKRLDDSQKPYYVRFSLQRWLVLVLDLFAAGVAIVLIVIAIKLRHSTSEARFGLSFYQVTFFSRILCALIQTWTYLETSVGTISRLRTYMRDTPTEAKEGLVAPPADWPQSSRIEIHNVTARYNGKSSLLLALLGFLDYAGRIEIDGVDLATLDRDALRAQICTISQQQLQLSGSVRTNLRPFTLLSSTEPDSPSVQAAQDEELQVLLARLRIWEPIRAKNGLDAILEDVGLSHGQTQLLCVARAVVRRRETGARLVLVDEATSGVDLATDEAAREVAEGEFEGCTVVTVAHRAESVARADVRVELAHGEVVRTVWRRMPEGSGVGVESGTGGASSAV